MAARSGHATKVKAEGNFLVRRQAGEIASSHHPQGRSKCPNRSASFSSSPWRSLRYRSMPMPATRLVPAAREVSLVAMAISFSAMTGRSVDRSAVAWLISAPQAALAIRPLPPFSALLTLLANVRAVLVPFVPALVEGSIA